jgi:hypothetical protein
MGSYPTDTMEPAAKDWFDAIGQFIVTPDLTQAVTKYEVSSQKVPHMAAIYRW